MLLVGSGFPQRDFRDKRRARRGASLNVRGGQASGRGDGTGGPGDPGAVLTGQVTTGIYSVEHMGPFSAGSPGWWTRKPGCSASEEKLETKQRVLSSSSLEKEQREKVGATGRCGARRGVVVFFFHRCEK